MLINGKVIREFIKEFRERGLGSALEVYSLRLQKIVTLETMSSIDKHEHVPYKCRGIKYIRRRILWGISNHVLKKKKIVLDQAYTNVLFAFFGGLGDLIINRNYLLHLKSFLHDPTIRFFVTSDRDAETLSALIPDKGLQIISLSDECSFKQFDVLIRMIRYPVVVKYDYSRVRDNKILMDYIQSNCLFQKEYREIL